MRGKFIFKHNDMIGAIIGGIASLGSAIFGGVSAADRAREEQKRLAQEKAANRAWYERRYNEDATQRADAQRALTLLRERLRQNNAAADGTRAVMGGTEESVAATRAANADAMAEATSQIAAAGEERKDKIEDQYRKTDSRLSAEQRDADAARSQAIAQATGQAISAAGTMGSAIGEYFGGNGTTPAQAPAQKPAQNQTPTKAPLTNEQLQLEAKGEQAAAEARKAGKTHLTQGDNDAEAARREYIKANNPWHGNAW